jgi:diketogulonate reductase-like aldo/keto reductase
MANDNPIKLSTGRLMPPIGYGMWLIQDQQEAMQGVKNALDVGYRQIDTAQYYGNEQYIGEALEQSAISRSSLFITTKIKNENQNWDLLIPSFDESLKKLHTDYADLLLLHFPVTELRRPAWRLMERLYNEGRARSIGVSNYTIRHLEELLRECDTPPAVNQVELHVYLQQPELVEFCKRHDILVEAYSPLAHGEGLDNPVLAEVAKKHHKSPAQIMLRWCIEAGTVPLPKSVRPDRIKSNFDVFDFSLDHDDMAKLHRLNSGLRTCWDPTNVA